MIGAIVPWNFAAHGDVEGRASAGDGHSVALKPAEHSPMTAIRLGELALESGLPPGVGAYEGVISSWERDHLLLKV